MGVDTWHTFKMYDDIMPVNLHESFQWIPRKTDSGWTIGHCFYYYRHHRGGADTTYVSNEGAMAMILSGTANRLRFIKS